MQRYFTSARLLVALICLVMPYATMSTDGWGQLFAKIRALWILARLVITKGLIFHSTEHIVRCAEFGYPLWDFEISKGIPTIYTFPLHYRLPAGKSNRPLFYHSFAVYSPAFILFP